MGVTRSLVDAYLCTDGLPIDKSPLYNGQINSVSEFENRDPRFNATIVKAGDLYYDHTTPYIPEIRSRSGYLIQKNYDKLEHEEDAHSYIDHMLIRYAEVLLNYAEAIFELDGVISDENLNISINLIRNRVALPPLTNAFITDNGLNMQEEIRRERRVELALEGFRYDDLIRWKTAETELPKAIWGVRLFSAEYPKDAPGLYTMTPDSFIIVEQASNRHFDPSKHYLWPLPLEQLGLNGKLKQNPNW